MAYVAKYKTEGKDIHDNNLLVVISERDYVGVALERRSMPSAAVVSWQAISDDKYAPIIESTARIGLYAESDYEFLNLYSADARKHKVDIYKTTNKYPVLDVNVYAAANGSITIPQSGGRWQDFKAGRNGQLLEVDLYLLPFDNNGMVTVEIIDGAANTGSVIATSTILCGSKSQFYTFEFTIPPVLVKGNKYTIRATTPNYHSIAWWGATTNIYADGTCNSTVHEDLFFRTIMNFIIEQTDSLLWTGFVAPDVYSEPLINTPYPVTITAVDGLGQLNKKYWPDTNPDTWVSLYTTIANCLAATDNSDFILANNLQEVNNAAVTNQQFTPMRTAFKASLLQKDDGTWKSYLQILEELLTALGMQVFQEDGHWVVIRTDYRIQVYQYSKWLFSQSDTSEDFSVYSRNPEIRLTTPTASRSSICRPLDANAVMNMRPAWKEFLIVHDYGLENNVIPYGDIQPSPSAPGETYVIPGWSYVDGTVENGHYTSITIDYETGNYAMYIYGGNANFADCGYAETTINGFNYDINQSLLFEIAYRRNASGSFYIEIRYGAEYLDADGNWNGSSTQIEITDGKGDNFKTLKLLTDGLPVSGSTLRIRIYQSHSGTTPLGQTYFTGIDFVKAQLIVNNDSPAERLELTTEVNENNNVEPEPINTVFGDIPDIDNAEKIYTNYLYNSNGAGLYTPTSSWEIPSEGIERPLLDHLAVSLGNNHSRPTQMISWTLRSEKMRFGSTIIDTFNQGRRYIWNRCDWDIFNCEWTGEVNELFWAVPPPLPGGYYSEAHYDSDYYMV